MPLRYQVRKDILDFIVSKGYRPGDQFPSEQELSEILGVSRFSLREAIHLLEEERIIATKHGTGRFLAALPDDFKIELTTLQSVTELLAGYQITAANILQRVERLPASKEIALLLNLAEGEPIIVIHRLRYASNELIIASTDTLPEKILPSPWSEDDFRGSLFNFLEERCKIRLDYSQTTIHTTILDQKTHPWVQDPTIPWILLEQVIFNQDGAPVIFSRDYHRGDNISFFVRRFRRQDY